MSQFDYEIVKNPEIFEQNRLAAHSDHEWYRSEDATESGFSDYKYKLNGVWRFNYARNYDLSIKDFYKKEVDCRNWDTIRVPAHIQTEGYDVPQYANTEYPWDGHELVYPGEIPVRFNPTASYVKYFTLPDGFEKGPVYISFQGVESGMALWLNGEYVGYSEDSFTPSEFDLTPYIDRTGENKLAVMVFKFTAGSWCEDQDFFRFSGIFRDVWLYTVPDIHIYDMKITTPLSDDYKKASIELAVKATERGNMHIRVFDLGDVVAESTVKLDNETKVSIPIDSPKLWSAEKPNLYDLYIEVTNPSDRLMEVISERVGIREIKIGSDHILRINGQRIVFRGVNRHEFSSEHGRALPVEDIVTDIINMKRHNINAIRTSHYPNKTALYRLCDEYGIYLIDETNLETHGTWDVIRFGLMDQDFAVPGDRKEFAGLVIDRVHSMYERDKNHASIVIWSLGNEAYGGRDIFEMHEALKSWDTTRPIHYEGIFWDKRYPLTSDIASSMYEPVESIKEYLSTHRDKPYINCEYAHAMGNSCGAIKKYTDLTDEEPLFQGGFIWDYIDQSMTLRDRYGVEFQGYGGDFGDLPNDGSFSGNGIAYGGPGREPSPKMQEIKYVYQNLQIRIEDGQVHIDNRYLFTDAEEYNCVITFEVDGKVIDKNVGRVEIAPQSSATIPLPMDIPNVDTELVVGVSFVTKRDTLWAPAGHEVAYGQAVIGKPAPRTHQKLPVRITRGWWNTGIQGEDFEIIFSRLVYGMTGYLVAGENFLKEIPRPNFWRAITENDRANLQVFRSGQWKLASMYPTNKREHGNEFDTYETEDTGDGIRIVLPYHLPIKPAKDVILAYTIHSDGWVDVDMTMEASADVGELPEFSVMFTMPADYDTMEWYGKGPQETYADRDHAKLGHYKRKVTENMAKYLVPSECGNHTGVRYMEVKDRRGRGLRFEGENLSVCVLPYSPHELECARHINELPPIHRTYVRVGLAQMGIAGDDTWGATVHPEFMIDNSKPLSLHFSFRAI